MWQLNTLMFFSVLYIGMSQAHADTLVLPPANDPGYVSVAVTDHSERQPAPTALYTGERHTTGAQGATAKSRPADNRILSQIF